MSKVFLFSLLAFLIQSCGEDETGSDLSYLKNENGLELHKKPNLAQAPKKDDDMCPLLELPPQVKIEDLHEGEIFVDTSRELKDLSTDIVVKRFFTTPEMFFNFLKLVYSNIDSALDTYKKNNGLTDRAVFVMFKGGNVLRMVANGVFENLPPYAREFLKNEYLPYFNRSDADFAVFVDENKLGKNDYDETMREVAQVISKELDKIRTEFKANPQKYFNFVQLKTEFGSKELDDFLSQANKIGASQNERNEDWYNANFKQIQFKDIPSKANLVCSNTGGYDYKYDIENRKLVTTRISDTPDWILKSDNRTIQFNVGTDPSRINKFWLERLKIAFTYIYEKDGKTKSQNIGGELVDVSISHRKDDKIRGFLDNYDKEVEIYKIKSTSGEELKIKAYSPYGLAEDLYAILFIDSNRPWQSGHKYTKRINRYFFLVNLEILHNYGLESLEAINYIKNVKENVINPLKSLLPLSDSSKEIVKSLNLAIESVQSEYPKLNVANKFLTGLQELVTDWLVKRPQVDDADWFKNFIEVVEKNLDTAMKLQELKNPGLKLRNIFKVDTKTIF